MPFEKGHVPTRTTRQPRVYQLTRREAIRAKCEDCICDLCQPGTKLQQIRECTSTDCPLHEWRPGAGTVQAAALSHGEEEATT